MILPRFRLREKVVRVTLQEEIFPKRNEEIFDTRIANFLEQLLTVPIL